MTDLVTKRKVGYVSSAARGPAPRPPDPRPQVDPATGTVTGQRCTACRHPLAVPAPHCPLCRAALAPARFGPDATVVAATVVRIPVGDRVPPYALAHVDLDDGPRVLVHLTPPDHAPPPGTRVRVCGTTALGDVLVQEQP